MRSYLATGRHSGAVMWLVCRDQFALAPTRAVGRNPGGSRRHCLCGTLVRQAGGSEHSSSSDVYSLTNLRLTRQEIWLTHSLIHCSSLDRSTGPARVAGAHANPIARLGTEFYVHASFGSLLIFIYLDFTLFSEGTVPSTWEPAVAGCFDAPDATAAAWAGPTVVRKGSLEYDWVRRVPAMPYRHDQDLLRLKQ